MNLTPSSLQRAWAVAFDREEFRFLVVGVGNTAFSYFVFLVALALFGPLLRGVALPLISLNYFLIIQWACWILQVPVSTLTMKYWAFRRGGHWAGQVFRAYFVYLPGLWVSSAILWSTVRLLHLPPAIGQLFAIAVTTVLSYLGHKYFTFRGHAEAPQAEQVVD